MCDVAPATSEGAARALIQQVRAGSRGAGHQCTAYLLGPDAGTVRSNDDGEPSGTAGAPMLAALRGRGITDAVAVVSRWFGGTLLGTGGLIRAYGDATEAALAAATTVTREERDALLVARRRPRARPSLGERASRRPRSVGHRRLVGVRGVTVTFAVDPAATDEVAALVAVLTGGSSTPVLRGRAWVAGVVRPFRGEEVSARTRTKGPCARPRPGASVAAWTRSARSTPPSSTSSGRCNS